MLKSVLDLVITPVKAQNWIDKNMFSSKPLPELIQDGLNLAVIAAGIVAVGFLVFNGIKYIMAGGDANKAQEAQKGLANALIGLALAVAAYVIVTFVMKFMGAQLHDLPDGLLLIGLV